MLDEKRWRADAVLRLFASVAVCTLLLGSLATHAVHLLNGTTRTHKLAPLLVTLGAFGSFMAALVLIGRKWSKEHFVREASWLFACIYAGLALLWWTGHWHGDDNGLEYSTADLIVSVLFFQGAALLCIFRFLREHGTNWAAAFGFGKRWVRALWVGTLTGIAIFAVIHVSQSGALKLMEHFRLEPQEQLSVQVVRSAGTISQRVILGIILILIAPPAEELLFRGVLYPAIKQRGFPRLALWGSSLAFAAVHVNLATFLPLTLLALVLVWLYERTNNLLAAITTHSLFNALNFLLLQAQPWLEQKLKWLY